MKNYEKATWTVLLTLLVIALGAVIFTHSWSDYRERLRAIHAQQENLRQRAERVRVELEELRDVVAEADRENAAASDVLAQATASLAALSTTFNDAL